MCKCNGNYQIEKMGAKHSKKRPQGGAESFSLFDKGEKFSLLDDFEFDVEDLERSTAQDRAHNSHGLPMDVLALIASHLSLPDVGRVARTCKTWRRMSLQPSVWLHFAKRMSVRRASFCFVFQ